MKDHEIIELYWARNQLAITATADKYGSYCHTIAYNILHNNEDAEECSNDTYLGAWNSIPPQRPNRLSIYLGKITRNLALNRYKRYTAEKRGHGQVELVLSELEACIPANTSVEQAIEEKGACRRHRPLSVFQAGTKPPHLCPPVLAPLRNTGYCGCIRNEREQGDVAAFSYEKRVTDIS